MLMPELILFKGVRAILQTIKQNWKENDENQTLLYDLFKKDDNTSPFTVDGLDFYDEAKTLLLREAKDQRSVQAAFGYNKERLAMPTIHIIYPIESGGRIDSLGDDDHEVALEVNTKKTIDPDHPVRDFIKTKRTSNQGNCHLMITSNSYTEVVIIYYVMKAAFMVYKDTFSILGVVNLRFSGQEINLSENLAPPDIYHRSLSLAYDFEFFAQYRMTAQIGTSFDTNAVPVLSFDP